MLGREIWTPPDHPNNRAAAVGKLAARFLVGCVGIIRLPATSNSSPDRSALDFFLALVRWDHCSVTLARAHARSGDPAATAGYTGKSDALDDAQICKPI
jgi:hypothetical protein